MPFDALAPFLIGVLVGVSLSAIALARVSGVREERGLRLARASGSTSDADAHTLAKARVVVARGLAARLVGLLNHAQLAGGDALLLRGTRSVHTRGMGFPIDVVFLDARGRVLDVRASLAPDRVARGPAGTRATLEVASGAALRLGLTPGAVVTLIEPREQRD